MMSKRLVYGYGGSVSSPRKIPPRLVEDVAFRTPAAGNEPDFRTISHFRKIHRKALQGCLEPVRGSASTGCGSRKRFREPSCSETPLGETAWFVFHPPGACLPWRVDRARTRMDKGVGEHPMVWPIAFKMESRVQISSFSIMTLICCSRPALRFCNSAWWSRSPAS